MRKKIIAIIVTLMLMFTGSFALIACNSGVVEIEFFQQNQQDEVIFNKIILDFQKENPKIRVKQISLPEEIADSVKAIRFQNNDIPDIFNDWFNSDFFDGVDNGQIKDMTDSELLQYIDTEMLDSVKYNGKNYMIPMTRNYVGVYYNKAIFNQHGISIPETLEEFWEVCKTLKSKGVLPIVAADQDGWNLAHWAQSIIGMYMPNYSAEYKSIFNGTLKVAEMQGISDLANIVVTRTQYVQTSPLGTGTDSAVAEFALGHAAMFLNGSWLNGSIESVNNNLDYAVFPFPGPTNSETRIMSNADYSFALSAKSSPKKAEATETFLRYLLTDGAKYYISQTHAPSAIIDVKADSSRYTLIKKIMDDGSFFRMTNQGRWTSQTYLDYTVALQNLVLTGNKNTFYQEFEDALTSSGIPKVYID